MYLKSLPNECAGISIPQPDLPRLLAVHNFKFRDPSSVATYCVQEVRTADNVRPRCNRSILPAEQSLVQRYGAVSFPQGTHGSVQTSSNLPSPFGHRAQPAVVSVGLQNRLSHPQYLPACASYPDSAKYNVQQQCAPNSGFHFPQAVELPYRAPLRQGLLPFSSGQPGAVPIQIEQNVSMMSTCAMPNMTAPGLMQSSYVPPAQTVRMPIGVNSLAPAQCGREVSLSSSRQFSSTGLPPALQSPISATANHSLLPIDSVGLSPWAGAKDHCGGFRAYGRQVPGDFLGSRSSAPVAGSSLRSLLVNHSQKAPDSNGSRRVLATESAGQLSSEESLSLTVRRQLEDLYRASMNSSKDALSVQVHGVASAAACVYRPVDNVQLGNAASVLLGSESRQGFAPPEFGEDNHLNSRGGLEPCLRSVTGVPGGKPICPPPTSLHHFSDSLGFNSEDSSNHVSVGTPNSNSWAPPVDSNEVFNIHFKKALPIDRVNRSSLCKQQLESFLRQRSLQIKGETSSQNVVDHFDFSKPSDLPQLANESSPVTSQPLQLVSCSKMAGLSGSCSLIKQNRKRKLDFVDLTTYESSPCESKDMSNAGESSLTRKVSSSECFVADDENSTGACCMPPLSLIEEINDVLLDSADVTDGRIACSATLTEQLHRQESATYEIAEEICVVNRTDDLHIDDVQTLESASTALIDNPPDLGDAGCDPPNIDPADMQQCEYSRYSLAEAWSLSSKSSFQPLVLLERLPSETLSIDHSNGEVLTKRKAFKSKRIKNCDDFLSSMDDDSSSGYSSDAPGKQSSVPDCVSLKSDDFEHVHPSPGPSPLNIRPEYKRIRSLSASKMPSEVTSIYTNPEPKKFPGKSTLLKSSVEASDARGKQSSVPEFISLESDDSDHGHPSPVSIRPEFKRIGSLSVSKEPNEVTSIDTNPEAKKLGGERAQLCEQSSSGDRVKSINAEKVRKKLNVALTCNKVSSSKSSLPGKVIFLKSSVEANDAPVKQSTVLDYISLESDDSDQSHPSPVPIRPEFKGIRSPSASKETNEVTSMGTNPESKKLGGEGAQLYEQSSSGYRVKSTIAEKLCKKFNGTVTCNKVSLCKSSLPGKAALLKSSVDKSAPVGTRKHALINDRKLVNARSDEAMLSKEKPTIPLLQAVSQHAKEIFMRGETRAVTFSKENVNNKLKSSTSSVISARPIPTGFLGNESKFKERLLKMKRAGKLRGKFSSPSKDTKAGTALRQLQVPCKRSVVENGIVDVLPSATDDSASRAGNVVCKSDVQVGSASASMELYKLGGVLVKPVGKVNLQIEAHRRRYARVSLVGAEGITQASGNAKQPAVILPTLQTRSSLGALSSRYHDLDREEIPV